RKVEDCEASSTRLRRTTPNAWTCFAASTLRLDQAKRLTERRLVEAPQLARVQRVELATQQIQGGDADLKMLGHGSLVEGIGRTGQLDLAMQGLVRDTQQRAVGDPQPVSLGGDGAAFHIHRHRAR